MRKLTISISMLMLSLLGYGQQSLGNSNSSVTDLPNVIPPSPTVANLMKFEEVPVDTYSGQPNISIPLYAKKLDGGLGFSASLSYNTSGVKIDERSGWTGTGWSLFAGGVISRTVMGIHDEAKEVSVVGDGAPGDVGAFHSGFYDQVKYLNNNQTNNGGLINIVDPNFLKYQEFLWNTTYGAQNYDYQPDLFQFNFMGYSGRFIIVNDNGILKPKLLSSSQKIKIELGYDNSTFNLTSFTITAPNGYQFVFGNGAIETTRSYGRKSGQSQSGSTISDDINSFKENVYTSSWHLTTIKSPSNYTVCTFNYQDKVVNYSSPKSIQKARTLDSPSLFNMYFLPTNANAGYNASFVPPASMVTWNVLQVGTKKLKDVIFRDGSKVVFKIKDGHPEQDNSTGCVLDKIEVYDVQNVKNKEFNFQYKTTSKNRLFLTNVIEKAGTKLLSYNLTYNNEEALPGYDSLEKDRWGYYKYSTLTTTGLQFTQTDLALGSGSATTGLLSGITLPTGGTKEFTFEPHEFSFLGNVLVDPKDIDENYEEVTGINTTTLRHSPINTGISNSTLLQLPNDTKVTLYLSNLTGNNNDINNHYLEFVPTNSSLNTIQIHDLRTSSVQVNLKQGTYQVRLNSPAYIPTPEGSTGEGGLQLDDRFSNSLGSTTPITTNSQSNGSGEVSVRLTLRYVKYLGAVVKHKTGGGFRIKEIRFMDGADQKTKVNYSYSLSDAATKTQYNISENSYSSGSFDGALGTTRKSIKEIRASLRDENVFGGQGFEVPPCAGSIHDLSFLVERFGRTVEASMSKGNYVGYKNVEVYQENNGKTVMLYTNAIDYPTYDAVFYEDIIPSYYNNPNKDLDFKRGNLLESTAFNQSGEKVTKTINNYDYQILASERYFFKYSEHESCSSALIYRGNTLSQYKTYLSSQSGCEPCTNPANFIDVRPAYYEYGLPFVNESISEQYFYDASGNQKKVVSSTSYNYSLNNYQPIAVHTTNSKGETLTTSTKYAHEVNNTVLQSLHRINEPVEIETSKRVGTTVTKLSGQKTLYKYFGTDLYLPEVIQTSKGTNVLKDRVVYHNYDNKGNPTEVSKKDGTSVVYIWGYNQTQPIAKIEGVALSAIPTSTITSIQNLSNKDDDRSIDFTGDEGALRLALNNLRTLSSLNTAQITTFTYDPVVGVTSITDPRGETLFYEYDEFNRLKLIRNSEGFIVNDYQYNYKN
ncbi:hypothetical protein [Tenacibaculum sp. 190524A05c]|uniref:Rhs family protein n=1 Tax=Tenacibaculum platacis TaxID=3137852 RepID=A0ABP1EI98_9FLAO